MPRSAVSLIRLLPASDPAPADAPLLRAFGTTRSDGAFEELVRRHGPMVLAACRRVLGNADDAEDAFQAVFLVLARKANTIHGANLAGWLYGVAVRTARGVRIMRERRRKHETRASIRCEPAVLPATDHDLAAVIDEELARLPEHYRLAVVLCELRGQSRKQAATELGIPEGTLASRLAAAKRKLAALLSARGLAPAALVALLAPASVSAGLVESAVSAVRGTAGPVASAAAAAVVKAMLFNQFKAVTLAAGILLTVVCGGWAVYAGAVVGLWDPFAFGFLNGDGKARLAAHAKVKAFLAEQPKSPVEEAESRARRKAVTDLIKEMVSSPRGLYWEARYNPRVMKLPAEAIAQVFREKIEDIGKNEKVPDKELTALLLMMRRNPSNLFATDLKRAVESPSMSTSSKVETLITLGTVDGSSEYLMSIVKAGDDRMRAAALDAVCLRGEPKDIQSVVQELTKKDVDHTGTHTGTALSNAKSLLDTMSAYRERKSDVDRLQFLLTTIPYSHPKPGLGLPYIRFDGYANFVMSELGKLARADPKGVKESLGRRAKEKGDTAWVAPLLLRDLELESKPLPTEDPK